MGRMSELHAEMREAELIDPRNPFEELHFEAIDSLRRVVAGTATADDARILAIASGVSLSEVGLATAPNIETLFNSGNF